MHMSSWPAIVHGGQSVGYITFLSICDMHAIGRKPRSIDDLVRDRSMTSEAANTGSACHTREDSSKMIEQVTSTTAKLFSDVRLLLSSHTYMPSQSTRDLRSISPGQMLQRDRVSGGRDRTT